jgi:hypothetical protein
MSIALVDWTSLEHARRLLSGEILAPRHQSSSDAHTKMRESSGLREAPEPQFDPFVALGDLASIVGALIFHDRVAVLDHLAAARRAHEVFGMEGVIRGIRPGRQNPTEVRGLDFDYEMRQYLDGVFKSAGDFFAAATRKRAPWLRQLRGEWERLLPGVTFPPHDRRGLEKSESGLRYVASQRASSGVVFEPGHGYWEFRPSTHLKRLIRENDIRALFYEHLASDFERKLADEPRKRRSVRYVGGCLRSPLLLTRAAVFLATRRGAENWAQQYWSRTAIEAEESVRVPFWMDAVLARAKTPQDVVDAVAEFRHAAEGFRRRRLEFDEALQRGDRTECKKLAAALRGELPKFDANVRDASVASGTVILKSVLPLIPSEVHQQVGRLSASMIERLTTRLFRPHVWVVYEIQRAAAQARNSMYVASRVFQLPDYDASQSIAFMERLGQVAWIA